MADTARAMVRTRRSAPDSPPPPKPTPQRRRAAAATAAATTSVVQRTLGITGVELRKIMEAQHRLFEENGWLDLSEEVRPNLTRGRLNCLVMQHTLPY